MKDYWEEVMAESLATIKRITGMDVRADIRDIEETVAAFKRKPETTYLEAERLDTAKTGFIWACHEKKAHAAAAK